jgi:hypothetical protein
MVYICLCISISLTILKEAYARYGYNKNPNMSVRSSIAKTLEGMRCEQVVYYCKRMYNTVTTMGPSLPISGHVHYIPVH